MCVQGSIVMRVWVGGEKERSFLKWKCLKSVFFFFNSFDLTIMITLHVLPRLEG